MLLRPSLLKYICILFCLGVFFICNPILAIDYINYPKADVQVLNKVTGKVKIFTANINDIINADAELSFTVKACYKTTQKYDPEDVMFIYVAKSPIINKESLNNNMAILSSIKDISTAPEDNQTPTNKNTYKVTANTPNTTPSNNSSGLIFSGWMFSTAPEVSALVDPIYDIVIVRCRE